MIYSVIGSHFGDEGKGLMVDYLSSNLKSTLGVRHNGGAQSGHTVEKNDKRFVFHELSSGSFCHADTYWAETFFPDLYKLSEETAAFQKETGFIPKIYASPECCFTTIDDVLINMLLESSRKEKRHGSCGMGIYEAFLRKQAGYGISLRELKKINNDEFYERLLKIRKEYSYVRLLKEIPIESCLRSEYYSYLSDNEILYNYSAEVMNNLRYIEEICDLSSLLPGYENVIFESGQGLRLDSECIENRPYVTASRTGLYNVIKILDSMHLKLDEVVYVTRTYGTKHGAGPLCNELIGWAEKKNIHDKTNIYNPWQGGIRYFCFEDKNDLLHYIKSDLELCPYDLKKSLCITHLNETENAIYSRERFIPVEEIINEEELFDAFYLSSSIYSKDMKLIQKR